MPRAAAKPKNEAEEVKKPRVRKTAIATTEPPVRVWKGVSREGHNYQYNFGEEDCLFRRGRFAVVRCRDDWFEIFKESGNRLLSAIWDRGLVDSYLDRLESGEDSRRLQCEIDSNYSVLGGISMQIARSRSTGNVSDWMTASDRAKNYQVLRSRRMMIGSLYGDRRESKRGATA